MKARILRPEENYKAAMTMAVAFEWGMDYEKEKAEASKKEASLSKLCFGVPSEDESVVYGCMDLSLFDVRFDGTVMKMGGVGGVATLPPYRRGGAIRACMQEAFRYMYDNDFGFSCLYPFSQSYYRQFGFECGNDLIEWIIDMDALKLPEVEGSVEYLLPGEDQSVLTDLYNRVFSAYNLSVVREEFSPALKKENLLDQCRYIYVWKNKEGEPRGFFISKKNGEGYMDCTCSFGGANAFLFLDAQALMGMLRFVQTAFRANYKGIKLAVPGPLRIDSMVAEPNKAARKVFYNGMLRVINAKKVLEACKCKGSGSLTIKLKDSMLPENEGVWKLDFASNMENQVEKLNLSEADVEMDISDFGPLICGVREAADFPYMPGVTVRNQEVCEQVFYRKNCYVMNLF